MFQDGEWLAPPPNYDPIQVEGESRPVLCALISIVGVNTNLFSHFVDMNTNTYGSVIEEKELLSFFATN